MRCQCERLHGDTGCCERAILASYCEGLGTFSVCEECEQECLAPYLTSSTLLEEESHQMGCVCADCSGAELTARND